VTNCIPFVQKASPLSNVRVIKPDESGRFICEKILLVADFMPDEKTCVWKTSGEKDLLSRFKDMHCLGDYCYISVGMVLNADEKTNKGAFTKDDLISETKDKIHCREYIEAKDIERFAIKRIRFLEYGTKRCPGQLRRATFPELYDRPKILTNKIGCLCAVLDEAQLLCDQTNRILILWHRLHGVENNSITGSVKRYSSLSREEMERLSEEVDLRFLLAIVNSRFGFALLNAVRGGDGNIDLNPEYLRAIPIPSATPAQQAPIVTLVDHILTAKKKDSNADTSALESKIDQLVYKLYGLTDDEIAIVEGKSEANQEPQGETTSRPAASPRRRRQSTAPAIPAPTNDEVLE